MTPPDGLAAPTAPAPSFAAPLAVEPPLRQSPPRGPIATLKKHTKIMRVSLSERMTYRSDFLLGTILRFLPLVTTILLWKSIYESSGASELAGFRYREMIAYLLLTHISRMFSSMPGLAAGIARDIREGTLKRYLIQPVDMIGYLLSYRVAQALFVLCRGYFDGFPDALTLAAYVVSLVLSFLVGFFFEASVGMVGFWFLEVTSLLYIVMTLNFFISGHMLPLDLLPQPWSTILKALPFQYMAYFPAVVFLRKITGWELVLHLLLELTWAVVFMVLCRGLYRLGLKRYSAYGG
ncbi:MAG: ABC-2 family transporter protein [Isosphaeraceae bacterium]